MVCLMVGGWAKVGYALRSLAQWCFRAKPWVLCVSGASMPSDEQRPLRGPPGFVAALASVCVRTRGVGCCLQSTWSGQGKAGGAPHRSNLSSMRRWLCGWHTRRPTAPSPIPALMRAHRACAVPATCPFPLLSSHACTLRLRRAEPAHPLTPPHTRVHCACAAQSFKSEINMVTARKVITSMANISCDT